LNSNVTGLGCDASGDIFVTGAVKDAVDMDPGPNEFILTPSRSATANQYSYNSDIYLSMFDPDGDFIRMRQIGGNSSDIASGLVVSNDSVIISGFFSGTADFGDGVPRTACFIPPDDQDPWVGNGDEGSAFLASYSLDNKLNWIDAWDMPFNQSPIFSILNGVSSLARDSNGNLEILGQFTGTRDFDPGEGVYEVSSSTSTNCYISKFDGAGNWLSVDIWDTGKDLQYGGGTATNIFGNMYALLNTYSNSYLRKYSFEESSSAGVPVTEPGPVSGENPLSARNFAGSETEYSGGFNRNSGWVKTWPGVDLGYISGILLDRDKNIYITGSFGPPYNAPIGGEFENVPVYGKVDAYLMKMGPDLSKKWIRSWGGPEKDRASGMYFNDEGNIEVFGEVDTAVDFNPGPKVDSPEVKTGNNVDVNFRSTFDTDGNYLGVETLHGNITSDDLKPDNYYNNGTANYGPGGNYNNFNGIYGSVVYSDDNAIYLIGSFHQPINFKPSDPTMNFTPFGESDLFLARYENQTTIDWVKVLSPKYDWSRPSVNEAILHNGVIYVAGMIDSPMDFDPGEGEKLLMASDCKRSFIATFDLSGNYIWGFAYGEGTLQANIPSAMAVDNDGAVYIGGRFNGRTDFCPGDEVYYVDSGYSQAGYLLKILPDGTW
ncbi:MAG: hypothetical protein ABIC40_04085, partial [bacterium]